MTFSRYTHFLCINAENLIFPLQRTSQAVSVKVVQAVSILRLL